MQVGWAKRIVHKQPPIIHVKQCFGYQYCVRYGSATGLSVFCLTAETVANLAAVLVRNPLACRILNYNWLIGLTEPEPVTSVILPGQVNTAVMELLL